MSKWNISEPFDIDDGQLDELTPQQCFVLGVEWQTVCAWVEEGKEGERLVHSSNISRLLRMARRRGVELGATTLGDGWSSIRALGAGSGEEECNGVS